MINILIWMIVGWFVIMCIAMIIEELREERSQRKYREHMLRVARRQAPPPIPWECE